MNPSQPVGKELLTRNRSLRERIRDSTSNIIPSFSTVSDAFSSSSKSRSVDQSLLSSSPPKFHSPLHRPHPSSQSPPKSSSAGVPTTSSSTSTNSSSSPIHSIKTETHNVTASDTLTNIAARYDCTPSELIKLNRLNTRLVFPGQVLRVPLKNVSIDNVFADSNEEKFVSIQQRKFIKINVRHITDGNGVVSGTLIITPNSAMFDPSVSDPLVLDQGAETYGVILPLEVIVHSGIYSDIAHMRVESKYNFVTPPGTPRPLLYPNTVPIIEQKRVSKSSLDIPEIVQSSSKKEKVLKRLSFPLTWMESLGAAGGKEEIVEAKSAPPTAGHEKKRDSKSFSKEEDFPMANLLDNVDKLISRHDSMSRSKSSEVEEDLTWYLCLTTGRPKTSQSCGRGLIVSYGQKNHLRPEYWFHIVDKNQVDELYKFWMIWWPHLYSEFVDRELIAARGYELIDWDNMDLDSADKNKQLQASNFVDSDVNEFTKESWEMLKSPYTRLSSILNRSQTLLTSTSSSATNFGQGILDSISDFATIDYNNELEVVSMSDELRAALYGNSFCGDDFNPELIGNSEILNELDISNISKHLTARAQGYPWTLMFTTSHDGFSLSTLYRKMSLITEEETPILLVIEDTLNRVFGALVSTSFRPSESFYGTGQSFLFNLKPEFKIYKWTGDNLFFIKGGMDGIVVGAGDGKFGLWLDNDLNCGRSDVSTTYGNEPLVEECDFVIKTLECWAFLTSSSSMNQRMQQMSQDLDLADEQLNNSNNNNIEDVVGE